MSEDPTTQLVEITFAGTAPVRRIERASGVSRVEVHGRTLRCLVRGSFQPFLEAVRGYEVIGLTATPAVDAAGAAAPGGDSDEEEGCPPAEPAPTASNHHPGGTP